MSMPYYVAPEQVMKDRAEYAQKGIARGRSLVATTYDAGIPIVAENPSRSLHKISEIYDRIAFGGVGKYNEFDQLRVAGVRHADTKGYAFSREDVDARSLANLYAQYPRQRLHPRDEAARGGDPRGRARGRRPARQLYHVAYEGTITDEDRFAVLGGEAETISERFASSYVESWPWTRPEGGGRRAGRPRPHPGSGGPGGGCARPEQRPARLPAPCRLGAERAPRCPQALGALCSQHGRAWRRRGRAPQRTRAARTGRAPTPHVPAAVARGRSSVRPWFEESLDLVCQQELASFVCLLGDDQDLDRSRQGIGTVAFPAQLSEDALGAQARHHDATLERGAHGQERHHVEPRHTKEATSREGECGPTGGGSAEGVGR